MEPVIDTYLNPEQLELVRSLTNPAKIQAFLDATTYSVEDTNRSPLQVLQDRTAHCLDGGLFAAAMLRRLGHPPLVVDIFPDQDADDDHVLAIFKRDGYWGVIAKSNYVNLRYRDPVYRNLHELVMSYFDGFFNTDGVKTLRSYTRALNLARFDALDWLRRSDGVDKIYDHMKHMHRYALITPEMVSWLNPVDGLSYEAGMLRVNPAGLFVPRKSNA